MTTHIHNEVELLARRIDGLIRVRELLGRAGASEQELERQAVDIRRLQDRLAERVRRTHED